MAKENFRQQMGLLKRYGGEIQWNRRGKGPLSLARELYRGESMLRYVGSEEARSLEIKEGLLRELSISAVYVFHHLKNGKTLQLSEAMQVYNSGEKIQRNFGWVSEKMLPGETPRKTAQRALQEELSLKLDESSVNERIKYIRDVVEANTETAYPGIASRVTAHDFAISLNDEEYFQNRIVLPSGETVNGFKEVQKDKTTYFTWMEVNSSIPLEFPLSRIP